MYRHRLQQAALAVIASLLTSSWPAPAQRMLQIASTNFPCAEKLSYRVEWHGITAGLATVSIAKGKADEWQTTLDLQSAGMVSRLYNIRDKYKLTTGAKSCSDSSELEAEEGKHHKYEKLSFDPAHRKVDYYEHDLVKNQEVRKELDTPACTFEIVGALGALRTISLDPGRSITIPVTDGKKLATVRVDSQAKENVSVGGKNYATTRYEAYVFDNVLYRRKGRLEVWISDDGDHAPVQFRMQMGFPLGTVLVQLEKDEPATNVTATSALPDAS
jgi:hypothetical protein